MQSEYSRQPLADVTFLSHSTNKTSASSERYSGLVCRFLLRHMGRQEEARLLPGDMSLMASTMALIRKNCLVPIPGNQVTWDIAVADFGTFLRRGLERGTPASFAVKSQKPKELDVAGGIVSRCAVLVDSHSFGYLLSTKLIFSKSDRISWSL